jgi:internalin A
MTTGRPRVLFLMMIGLLSGSGLHADDAETEAVQAIEKLRGRVSRDEKADGKPVTEVYFLADLPDTPLELRHPVTDADVKELVKALASLKQLHTLDLWHTEVTDIGLKELVPLKHLQTLKLWNGKVTDAGMKELAALKHLHTLELLSAPVTDVGLKELAALKHLRSLDLGGTKRPRCVHDCRKLTPKRVARRLAYSCGVM